MWLDYAVRVKSISVLRAHFKRANASTFEEERMKALHHHRFSKYMLSACQKTPSEWASGDNEKDCLTDLRQFMVWLHDCASSTDPHDRQLDDQDNAVKSGDQSLEEMVKTGELQAVLDAGDVRRDPAMGHEPAPAADAKDMLLRRQATGTGPVHEPPQIIDTEAKVKRARTVADAKKEAAAAAAGQTPMSAYIKKTPKSPGSKVQQGQKHTVLIYY